MFRKTEATVGLAIACSLVYALVTVHGQSPADDPIARRAAHCRVYEDFGVVFVGRAGAPVTYRLSGEERIEEARQNLLRTKNEVADLRASLDPKAPNLETEAELAARIIRAESELNTRKSRYAEPFELTFIPVQVERAFRGVTEHFLMLQWRNGPSIAMEPGEQYLISGVRMSDQLPSFPEIPSPFDFSEYVIPARATPVASAQEDLRFLTSMPPGTTIFGSLHRQSSYEGPAGAPVGGIRIIFSSGTNAVETMTRDDGSYIVSGLKAGPVEIRPVLREDLTFRSSSRLPLEIGEGGCRNVDLTVAVNGRLRGRVLSADGPPLAGVEVVLQLLDSRGRIDGSETPTTTVRPNEDGTFAFFGLDPGSYVLSARRMRIENGREQYVVTYYSATPNVAEAVPIVIGRAMQLEGFDLLMR